MRLRLMIAMLVVVGITIASVVGFSMISTAREVNVYISRGGMYGLDDLVNRLEAYYQTNGSWDGADRLLGSDHGMMGNPGSGIGMMGSSGGANSDGVTLPNMMNDASSNLILSDANGTVVSHFRGKNDITQLTTEQIGQAIPLRARDGTTVVGYLYTDETAPIQPGKERFLTQKLYTSVRNGAFIGIGIAVLLSLLLGYWFLKPIQQMTRAAGELGKGDLNQRVAVSGNDELATLARTFNNMASSLQRAEESRKSMTADIAHELRTPLAVQRATIEAMVDGVYPMDEENLIPVMDQNLLLTRLVDDLRTLALADAGELRLEKVDTDLGSLAQSVLNRFHGQADKVKVELVFNLEGKAPVVLADPIRLEQILTNLIGNALRFTPPEGRVTVTVASAGKQATIRVLDTGPGLPEDSIPYVFDRFYRADKSRSRGEGGSGLGLAIARQLARAHQGDLSAANHPSGGAEFSLTLPL
jgi:two-component system, OmpR family, sensor histidine kinase BaeS